MQVLHDSRHGPYRTVGVFFVPRFFLHLHQQRQRPVFLQLSLTIARYVLLHTQGPFPARSKRNRARPTYTRVPVERRFLIEFSSIFMKILACRLAGHPVTFLAMWSMYPYERGSVSTVVVTSSWSECLSDQRFAAKLCAR